MPPELKKAKWQIVCVDDDEETRELLKVAAMVYPHVLFYLHHTKAGGERTLARQNYAVDAVILDIALEDGSGREATDAIRKKEPNYGHKKPIEIFWYTGWPIDLNNDYDPMTQTYYACQVRQLFRKPYAPTDMFEMILNFLKIPLKSPQCDEGIIPGDGGTDSL
jgi:DNA-binding NarL/FixJ family response regulator